MKKAPKEEGNSRDKKLANNATAFTLVRAAYHPVTHHCLVPALQIRFLKSVSQHFFNLWSAVCHWVLFISSALLPAVDQVATVVALRSSISWREDSSLPIEIIFVLTQISERDRVQCSYALGGKQLGK